jgi:hypothetical protein
MMPISAMRNPTTAPRIKLNSRLAALPTLAAITIPMIGKTIRMMGGINSPPWCRLFFSPGVRFPSLRGYDSRAAGTPYLKYFGA